MAELLENKDWQTLSTLHDVLIQMLREYYMVGGMPEAVNVFIETNDANSVREVQREILLAYKNDISKHTTKEQSQRIAMVWNSMPSQLSKEE